MKTIGKTISTLALAGCSVMNAFAVTETPGWYAGINLGQSRAKIDDAAITNRLLGAGSTSVSIDDDDRDTGYKLFGAYQFNKNFSLEGGYYDLGKFGYVATTVPAGSQTGHIRLKGLNFDAVGFLPFADRLSAFGRVGMNYTQAKDAFSATGAVPAPTPSARKSSLDYKLGLGLQYEITESFAMRLEMERYRLNDGVGSRGDVDLLSAGLIYRFGKAAQPAPPPAEPVAVAPVAAAPVAAAPAILVVVIAEPPPPTTKPRAAPPPPAPRMAVAYSTDSFYAFGTSELTQTGKESLDKFAAELKGVKFGVITVVGHTDRFGTHAYNQKLSEERAEAVKSYLVVSGGIPAEKIETRGAEELEPVTLPEDCVGKVATRKLINCLEADRRVDIDVTGIPGGK